jgi:Tfp pilus assembly protein PilZ
MGKHPGTLYYDHMPYVHRAGRTKLRGSVELDGDRGRQLGVLENISLGGVFVASQTEFRVGEHVTLRFGVPGTDDRLLLEVEVRWVRKGEVIEQSQGAGGAGFRFVKLSLYAAAVIDRYLRSDG